MRPSRERVVVAFANDWRTDRTSKHHLMRLLAQRMPVLWVETSGMRRPRATSAADWTRVATKLRRLLARTSPGAPGMTVLHPLGIPLPSSRIARALNARLYGLAVRGALRLTDGKTPPVLWVYVPTAARYLEAIPSAGLVYHCVDRWWEFSNYDADEMRRCHEILCRRADHVFASSLALVRDCEPFTDRVTYVPHGVEWSHFRQAVRQECRRPASLPRPGRPTITFVGLIDEWIDVELLEAVALQHPEADVIVVGACRVPVEGLAALPNVHLLGRRDFDELPGILNASTVALIPFRVTPLTEAVNPVKLREYLSAGVPVVTTALPEVTMFQGSFGVDIAANQREFLAAVKRRLEAPMTMAQRQYISDQMSEDTWSARLDLMLHKLATVLWSCEVQ